jgi:hypothetical protein
VPYNKKEDFTAENAESAEKRQKIRKAGTQEKEKMRTISSFPEFLSSL